MRLLSPIVLLTCGVAWLATEKVNSEQRMVNSSLSTVHCSLSSQPATPIDADGLSYRVTNLRMTYVHDLARLREFDLTSIQVQLGRVQDGYVAPRPDLPSAQYTLREIGRPDAVHLYASAIEHIVTEIRSALERAFNTPFFVAVDDRDIHPGTGADLRPRAPRARELRIRIEYTGEPRLIDAFQLSYLHDIDGQPSLDELMQTRVALIKTDEHGYVAWRPGVAPTQITIAEIAQQPTERYSAAAVQQILVVVRDRLTAERFMGVHVSPDSRQFHQRIEQPGDLTLVIVTGLASELRTIARGDRIKVDPDRPEHAINHPAHDRIRARSPIQPGVPGRQLLKRDQLDEYIYLLSRHPGRRVDVAIAPAEEDFTVSLDYLVTENKPWLIYAQGSNTGTRQTGRWRQRFGLFHSQLTGNDDILHVFYDTASFSDSHTVSGSYEARLPWVDSDRVRWRVHGLWSDFDASEVGFADLRFTGETWGVGGEIAANVYQDGPLFVDLFAGVRYMDISVENLFFDIPIQQGQETFLLPRAGVRLERDTEVSHTRASVLFELQNDAISSVDEVELTRLGRVSPDKDWLTLQWDVLHSFFLEPLLFGDAWRDLTTWETSTLAHEMMLGFRGQYAFENRLIPQMTQVAGGLYSVRGYPESIVAGDTVLIGTAEYRFHLPRIFEPQPDPDTLFGQPFRWVPQQVYGQADWNLLFRGFVDVGHTIKHDRLPFEDDHTLIGTGVGVEFLFRRNLNLRLDWGFALKGIDDQVSSGSSRLHFVGTLLF